MEVVVFQDVGMAEFASGCDFPADALQGQRRQTAFENHLQGHVFLKD